MTARIALVDLAEGTVLAVRAALGAAAVRVCSRGAVPAGTVLVLVEAGDTTIRDDLGLADPATPVLVLADWAARPAIELGDRPYDVLEKPFGSADLRLKVRALVESGAGALRRGPGFPHPANRAPSSIPATGGARLRAAASLSSRWLGEPLLEASVARALAASRRAGGPVWLVGEPGTGTNEVAAALARTVDDGREPAIWQDGEPLAAALARLDDAARVLWVPAIETKALGEQRALERFVALEPERRAVVTSGDDPELAIAAGTLARALVAKLARVSVRLAPLRERRRDLASLALAITADVASRLSPGLRVTFTDRAKHTLEAYGWPCNLVELESVLTRTLLSRAAAGNWGQVPIPGGNRDLTPISLTPISLELDADDLLFAPAHLAPLFPDDGDEEAATDGALAASARTEASPRRGVVVALGNAAAGRATSPAPASSLDGVIAPPSGSMRSSADSETASPAAGPHVSAGLDDSAGPARGDDGVEGVLLGFAHDIRNPMSTIKTFAALEASREDGETNELARLAAQACERVDDQLALLQRYSEVRPTSPVALDLVEVLGEAAESAGAEDDLVIAARRALIGHADLALARLVADAIVAECRARRAPESGDEPSTADTGTAIVPGTATLDITIPTGRAAVDRLDKWVAGTRFPWRLALARDAARRAGGSLDVEVDDGQIRLAWRLPIAGALESASASAPAGTPASAIAGTPAGAPAGATSGGPGRTGGRRNANDGALASATGEPTSPPVDEDEGKHDDQAGSPDRRRRSRSS